MNLLAALARVAKQLRSGPFHSLSPAQLVELKKHDLAIVAEPENAMPHLNRARYLVTYGADFTLVLDAVREALRLNYRNRKSCVNPYYLLEMAREDWDDFVRGQQSPEANYWLAYAVAAFEITLQRAPDLAHWNATHPPDWYALAVLQRAIKLELPRDETELPDSPDELKVLAAALAVAGKHCAWQDKDDEMCADIVAARVYTRALRVQYRDSKLRAVNFLPAARNGKLPDYRQLAFWNFVIELAPDEPRWWRERARWLSLRDYDVMAMRDMARAISLAPDEAALYEMRAKISPSTDWWDLSPTSHSKTADYLRAIRLRIGSGQIDGSPAKLCAQADQLLPAFAKMRGQSYARARAFYTLAIEAAPDNASLYMARADAGDMHGDPIEGEDGIYAANYCDYARALALDETLQKARLNIIVYLRNNVRRPTAHEQMEALLEARSDLIGVGIKPALANALIAEVERALAI